MINPCEQAGFQGGGGLATTWCKKMLEYGRSVSPLLQKKDQEGPLELD